MADISSRSASAATGLRDLRAGTARAGAGSLGAYRFAESGSEYRSKMAAKGCALQGVPFPAGDKVREDSELSGRDV